MQVISERHLHMNYDTSICVLILRSSVLILPVLLYYTNILLYCYICVLILIILLGILISGGQ